MAEQQPIQINLEPIAFSVTNVSISHNGEEFAIHMISGNQARLYNINPKHAKRVMMLLQNTIKDYEDKFGELKTELPTVNNQTENKKFGFNIEEERKD